MFRTNVLPLLLSQLKDKSAVPSTCCDDYILWQCIIDKLLENELRIVKDTRPSSKPPRVLSHVEQNGIRYAAGSVIRKLETKYKGDKALMECLCVLLKEEVEYKQDSTEQWLETTDRGGLYYITDTAFDLFIEIEIFVYDCLLSQKERPNLVESACSKSNILDAWSECMRSCTFEGIEKTALLLQEIIKKWIKIRGHSMTSMAMEQHKKEKSDTSKKRGTGTELKRSYN